MPVDRIVLKNGAILEGNILVESSDYLEIRIGEGQIVGISRKDAVEVTRGPATPNVPASTSAPVQESIPSSDEWFVIENRGGKVIGSCRQLFRKETEKSQTFYRLEENWTFFEAEGDLRVSWLEDANLDLSPRNLIYREEGKSAGKLVMAKVERNEIQVEISGGKEKKRVTLPWSSEFRFPLLSRLELKKKISEGGEKDWDVFDPAHVCMNRKHFSIGEKRVLAWEEKEIPIFVVREKVDGIENEEWIDPRSGTLRREYNGPDLVIRRASSAELETLRNGAAPSASGAAISDSRGRYRLGLLDSGWKQMPGSDSGSLLIKNASGDSAVLLFFLESPDKSSAPQNSLPVLDKKLSQSLERFQRLSSGAERKFQGKNAIEFPFDFLEGTERKSGRALLVGGSTESLVFLYVYPLREANLVPADWERWLARLELSH